MSVDKEKVSFCLVQALPCRLSVEDIVFPHGVKEFDISRQCAQLNWILYSQRAKNGVTETVPTWGDLGLPFSIHLFFISHQPSLQLTHTTSTLRANKLSSLLVFPFDDDDENRPQDAERFVGTNTVTISHDGNSIEGHGIGRQLNEGDTVYIECGLFEDSNKDNRITQCYAVVQSIVSDNKAIFKAPGLKWVPATLTSERDIEYIKSRKIVRHGSLNIRVERGNTLVGINEALKAQEQQQNGGVMASSATGTISKFVQKIFSKSPEPGLSSNDPAHMVETGTYTGADIPGSIKAPFNFNTNEATPLLKKSRSMNSTRQNPIYAAMRPIDMNARLSSFSTTHSSSVAGDADEDDDLLHHGNNGYATTHGLVATGNGTPIPINYGSGPTFSSSRENSTPTPVTSTTSGTSGTSGSSNNTTNSTTASEPARFPAQPCTFTFSHPIDHSVIYESVWQNFEDRRTVAVFPEGVSSDDYHLLDFKYGCTIMILGYLAQHSSKTLRIIPCGLNFFNRHRFRSRFYADYGAPMTVPDHLVAMYREGGEAKKQGTLLDLSFFYRCCS